jgi:hypothetical protein
VILVYNLFGWFSYGKAALIKTNSLGVVFLDEESPLLERGDGFEKLFYETGFYGYEDSIYSRYANLTVVEK